MIILCADHAGYALKEEIKIRDKELEEQKEINEGLNEKVNELEERLAKLEKLLNN